MSRFVVILAFLVGLVAACSRQTNVVVPIHKQPKRCDFCHTAAQLPANTTHNQHAGHDIGCADCHGGMPYAYDVTEAHGRLDKLSNEQLLPKSMQFAACIACHEAASKAKPNALDDPYFVAAAHAGALYRKHGCLGCHESAKLAPTWETFGRKVVQVQPVGPNAVTHMTTVDGHGRAAFLLESILETDVNLLPQVIEARDKQMGPAPLRMPEFLGNVTEATLLAGYVMGRGWQVQGPKPVTPVIELPPPGADGESLFREKGGCVACHKIGGVGAEVGPPLDGVGVKGPEWLRKSILEPMAELRPGYPPIMPPIFGTLLTEDELDAIIAYLMSNAR